MAKKLFLTHIHCFFESKDYSLTQLLLCFKIFRFKRNISQQESYGTLSLVFKMFNQIIAHNKVQ